MGPAGAEHPTVWKAETGEPLGPIELLDKINQVLPEKSIVLAKDFHLFVNEPNPLIIRKVKDCLAIGRNNNRHLVILGCQFKLVTELEKEFAVVDFALPDREQLGVVLKGIADSAGIVVNGNRDGIIDAASGMTTTEAADAFALAVVESNKTEINPVVVSREKSQCVKRSGILEILEAKETMATMGGCTAAKDWIIKRRHAFGKDAKAYGLPVPRGILLLGPPGSGKTHLAKIIANVLDVPLLKLDGGKLFSSLVGSSEANVRNAIATAEAVAPVVVLVDEIEKAFSGSKSSGQTDGGTSARVLGTFLQWMNDKTKPVFVVATSNDVSQLPPEFLRKGRFDELFFVDLPDQDEREEIFKIHIAKRNRKPDAFNIPALSASTNGFTGAEIEAVITESLFSAFDEKVEVENRHVLESVSATVPLSRTMAAQIEALRTWSNGRTRRASLPKQQAASQGQRKISA